MALKVHLAKPLATYGLAVLLSLIGVTWVTHLWEADLSIPFHYSGDSISHEVLIKCGIDNSWYLHNNFIGMPGGANLSDLRIHDNLHLLFFKVVSLFTNNPFLAINLYFLLTFPLTTAISLLVFFRFKVSAFPAIVASILYAFVPYHFMRGIPHILLSAYYLIPLAVMVCLWTYSKAPPFFENSNEIWRPTFRPRRKIILVLLICALVAAGGAYYAFFASYLILVAAIAGAIRHKRVTNLISGGILVSVITMAVLLNLSPTFVYHWKQGANPEVSKRSGNDAEVYGLKLAQLVLPLTGHRVPALANLKKAYNDSSAANENDTSSLGAIGSVGFILLIWQLLFRKSIADSKGLLEPLSMLNGAALLLGTLGGFGSLFFVLASGLIRGYNRISIFIAFLSFFAIALVLDKLWRRWATSFRYRGFMAAGLSVLLVFAVVDQTSGHFVPAYHAIKAEFESDDKFVKEIEASMPEGAMIFQLPYVPFPENGSVQRMRDYDLFRGYLHSSRLRWSYGAIRGREADHWQRMVSAKPVRELLDTLSLAGFSGIYIDRYGFPRDKLPSLEKELSDLLKTGPLVSKNGRLAFLRFGPYTQSLHDQVGEANWAARSAAALKPVLVNWKGGFSIYEGGEAENWRWCSSRGELHLINPSSMPRKIRLEMTLQSGHQEASTLKISSGMFTESLTVTADGRSFLKELDLPPGEHIVNFESNATRLNAPGDPRVLIFRVNNFRLHEMP